VLHTDSLGSRQTIRPGQLNLMTAGHGVAHAEETLDATGMHAVQLWVAQPESTRHGAPAFEHHAELPRLDVDGAHVTVISGTLANVTSPARTHTELVGAEIALQGSSATLPLRRDFEHALIVLDGSVQIEGSPIETSALAYLGSDRDGVHITGTPGSRALLLGGTPFETEPLMWWNFVARDAAEIEQARRDWEDATERFGTVRSRLARIPAPPRPQVRLA
jgi:quercetin 2,3-dioxygenase